MSKGLEKREHLKKEQDKEQERERKHVGKIGKLEEGERERAAREAGASAF